jgi:cell division protein FtsW (lipid II flippase)
VTTTHVAYLVIAAAFTAFFVMAHIAYDQFRLKSWQAFLMCAVVLLLLLMIMKRATDIANREHARGVPSESAQP